eukprot:1926186-Rhodomonas_salina.2
MQMEGEFKKASDSEMAKRKIVKVRRGGGGSAPVPDGVAEKPPEVELSKPFSWAAPVAAAADDAKAEEKKEEKPAEGADDKKEESSANGSADTEKEKKEEEGEKKPALFGGFGGASAGGGFAGFGASTGSGFSFGSTGSTPFTFGSGGTGSGFSFGGAGAKMASFASVGTQGWSTQKKEDGEDGEGGEADEDAEKEVTVKKGDGVVQLEEVETCTGEEDEDCVFQARAKLFTFGEKAKEVEEGAEKKEDEEGKEKAANKDTEAGGAAPHCWNVTGIGNIKVNIPKGGDPDRRPRIVMRRQKTFQVCLNTYLFESMVCDKAGPKDVRFTVSALFWERWLACCRIIDTVFHYCSEVEWNQMHCMLRSGPAGRGE